MSVVPPAPSAAGPAPAVAAASLCVRLGWAVSDLYSCSFVTPRATPPGQLPQTDQLTVHEQFDLNVARANALATRVAAADRWSADAPTLTETCDDQDWAAYVESKDRSDPVSRRVLAFHLAVSTQLATAGGLLPRAYQLGQALARLCRAKATPADLYAAFNVTELVFINQALNDLATALPDHAAKSAVLSITWWRDATAAAAAQGDPTDMSRAIGARRSDAPVLARRFARNRKIADADTEINGDALVRALPRQGELWRAVLVGAKDPLDLLTAEDYIAASKQLSAKARALLRKLPAAVWQIIASVSVFFVLVGIGGYWITRHGSDVSGGGRYAATVSALAATVAGWVAALWKVVSLRMKTAVAALEKPLWGASLDHVCGVAISLPPVGPSGDEDRWMKLADMAAKDARRGVRQPSADAG